MVSPALSVYQSQADEPSSGVGAADIMKLKANGFYTVAVRRHLAFP
jgi:hypothetical protein